MENSIESTDRFGGARVHLQTALSLMNDRDMPDYRNSIKESISAVEAVASVIVSEEHTTLGKALGILERPDAWRPGGGMIGFYSDPKYPRCMRIARMSPGFSGGLCPTNECLLLDKVRRIKQGHQGSGIQICHLQRHIQNGTVLLVGLFGNLRGAGIANFTV
ncbi:MAG: hypothetical protein ACI87W_003007 [Halieaceae bacterium]